MTLHAPSASTLPLRRPLYPDEWPETYLAALIRRNGLKRPWIYHIDQIRHTLPWHQEAGRDGDASNRFSVLRARDERPQYGSAPLPSWASVQRAATVRYCPMCMAERRYVRTRWRIPLLPVCTLHGCYLKKNLAEPALTVNYKREHFLRVADASSEEMMENAVCCMPEEFKVVSAVWGPLERAADAAAQPYADEALGELAGWTVLAWRLLELVARQHCREVLQRGSTGTLADVAQLTTDLRLSIAPSMEGIQTFMNGLRDNVHYLAASRCLAAIMLAETRNPTVLSRLPLAQLHDWLNALAPQMTVTTKAGDKLFRQERSDGLSRLQAIEYLGVSGVVVDRWVRKRVLPNVVVRKVGLKHFTFIARADLKQARRYLLSLIYVEDFLIEHGVDWPVYFALRKQGILEPVQVGDRRYLRRGDLADLTCQLEMMCSPAAEWAGQSYALFTESTLTLAGRQETYSAFVLAALEGRFPIWRRLDKPGLASFQVGHEGIAWLLSRRAVDRTRSWAPRSDAQMDLLAACT